MARITSPSRIVKAADQGLKYEPVRKIIVYIGNIVHIAVILLISNIVTNIAQE